MSSDGYAHQDWTPVIMKAKKTQTEAVPKVQAVTTTPAGKLAWKIEKQVDSDLGKPLNYLPHDTIRAIIGGRTSAKLTQKQLAQRLNIQEKDIKDIEAGKAIENKALISRIKRFLNI